MQLLFEDAVSLPTDAVESIAAGNDQSIFFVAAYKLQTNSEPEGTHSCSRIGGIQVYSTSNESSPSVSVKKHPFVACKFGILDLKAAAGKGLLVSAHSNNSAGVWRVRAAPEEGAPEEPLLRHSADLQPPRAPSSAASEALFLAADVCDDGDRGVFTTSLGELRLFDLHTQQQTDCVKAHALEAWTCAVEGSRSSSSLVFTGADDALIRGWDLQSASTPRGSPAYSIKWHSAGVCALQMHPTDPWLFASGSYDNALGLWDKRALSRPISSHDAGGGVWRIRWSSPPEASPGGGCETLWTACMYNGFQAFERIGTAIRRRASCLPAFAAPTDAVAYGLSLQRHGAGLLGTCTFYDGMFRLWRP